MHDTQGHSHIKLALQEYLRVWHQEGEPSENLASMASGA